MTPREVVAAVLTVAGLAAGVAGGFAVSVPCGLFVLSGLALALGLLLGFAPTGSDA